MQIGDAVLSSRRW